MDWEEFEAYMANKGLDVYTVDRELLCERYFNWKSDKLKQMLQ